MGKWDGLNRRKFPRVQYPCLIVLQNGQSHDAILTHTENLGIGGVCVILKTEAKMFSDLDLELDLLDLQNNIKCRGKVVWSVQRSGQESKKPNFYDVGIEFQSLDDAEQQRVDRLVKKLANAQK